MDHAEATLVMLIPETIVGHLIGPRGKCIKSLKAAADVNIHIQSEEELPPGTPERKLTITGTIMNVTRCQHTITQEVRSQLLGGMASPVMNANSEVTLTILIPQTSVKFVIGRSGQNVRDVQERSGAHVDIQPQAEASLERGTGRRVRISGTPVACSVAQYEILRHSRVYAAVGARDPSSRVPLNSQHQQPQSQHQQGEVSPAAARHGQAGFVSGGGGDSPLAHFHIGGICSQPQVMPPGSHSRLPLPGLPPQASLVALQQNDKQTNQPGAFMSPADVARAREVIPQGASSDDQPEDPHAHHQSRRWQGQPDTAAAGAGRQNPYPPGQPPSRPPPGPRGSQQIQPGASVSLHAHGGFQQHQQQGFPPRSQAHVFQQQQQQQQEMMEQEPPCQSAHHQQPVYQPSYPSAPDSPLIFPQSHDNAKLPPIPMPSEGADSFLFSRGGGGGGACGHSIQSQTTEGGEMGHPYWGRPRGSSASASPPLVDAGGGDAGAASPGHWGHSPCEPAALSPHRHGVP